ncbi:MAG: 30S ribosomal protein S9 [bacterium]|nr:30S ribosomal protein S9 [bacterium]
MPSKKKPAVKSVKKPAPKTHLEIPRESAQAASPSRYIETVGRRKTSVARVRVFPDSKFSINVNEKPFESYFPTFELKNIVEAPFTKPGLKPTFSVTVKVKGGGIHSQAEAVRHGISRALEIHDPALRKILKPLGFLKRDPRMKERRKFGLKKARKAPQWAKR